MQSASAGREFAAMWDITTPLERGRLPGVRMAGFRGGRGDTVDIQVVPYPAVTVFFDFGDGIVVDDGSGQTAQGSFVIGLAPATLRGHGRQIDCLQVRLSPPVAYALFGSPGLLGETVVGLDDLWGHEVKRIHEQLREAASWDDRFAIAEDVLARRLDEARRVDAEVSFAWKRMVMSHGRLRVDQLAVEIGWSRKRLWSQFRSQTGITPKRAAQLVRFDRAAHRLAKGESIAQVALASGYVDQSHLNREVMAFAGLTPAAIAAAPWLAVDHIAWPTR